MTTAKYAPKRDDGLAAYVVTTSSWGRQRDRIEWAESLTEAKRAFGWTRDAYAYVSVRRATPIDLRMTK